MKLLVVSHACATAINQQFYAALEQAAGWDITLLVPGNWINEYGKSIATKWPEFRGRIINRDVWKPGNIILHAYRGSMKKLLRQVNPDAIYVHHEPYAVATAQVYWANARTINRPIGFYSAQNIAKKYPLPFRLSERFVYRHSSFSFPITQSVDAVHRDKGYRGKSKLLPLGIDPTIYRPYEDVATVRQELGVQDHEVLIGYLGRIVPEKGLATLIRGLSRISDRNWRLAVIGAGSYEDELARLVAELSLGDRVIRRNYVPHDQAPRYFSAFDITVLPSETQPSWKEQFGRVIVESLACGTPVLGSDSGEIPVLIRELEGGLSFHEADPDDLAVKLQTFLQNPSERKQAAARGRQRVLERYTNQVLVQRFINAIGDATGHGEER